MYKITTIKLVARTPLCLQETKVAKALVTFLSFFLLGSLPAFSQSQVFTGSGTFVVPAGVNQITVECIGGGGRGATRTLFQGAGGGGGGGAYSRKLINVTPATSFAITVGAGSTSSSAGGESWFGTNTTVMAKGGNSGSGTTGGVGGSAATSVGDTKFNGGNGSGSGGGGSSAGNSAAGTNGSGGTGATAPSGGGNGGGTLLGGSAPGGGGGGGAFSASPGSGGAGRVIVSWVIPAVTSITPAEICAFGDHNVNLTGTNFVGATAVKFNGVDALSFSVNSNTSLSAVAPDGVTSGPISITIPAGTGTSSISLTVKENPVIQPITNGGVTLCAGETADYDSSTPSGTWASTNDAIATVNADGIVTAVSAGTATISYSITDLGCSSSVVSPVTVTNPVNSTNPATQSVVTGSTAVFSVAATGSIVSYQWKVSTDTGQNFTDVIDDATYSGATTSTLSIANTPLSFNGNFYQVVITPLTPCVIFESSAAILNVGDTGISADPVNVTLCSDGLGEAQFSISSVGAVNSYVWKENQGLEMVAIVDGTFGGVTYSGATTSQLTISGLQLAHSGWSYEAVAVGPNNSATSNIATLTVNEAVNVIVSPSQQSVCYSGGSATFSVEASGAVSGYQWQYSSDGIDFANVVNGIPAGATYDGEDLGELTVTTSAATPVSGTYFYRAEVFGASPCGSTVSEAGQLLIYTPAIDLHPAPSLVAAGNSTTFSVGTSEPSPTYQWQMATAVGGPYTDVASGTPAGITYSGENTSTLTVGAGPSAATAIRFYRAVVTSGDCSVSSNGAQLSIAAYCAPQSSIGNVTDAITNVVLANAAQGTNITQSSSGAAPWYTVYNNAPLNIVQGQTLSASVTFGSDGNQYSAMWIDYNRNGVFETNENVALATSANGGNTTINYSVLIPFTASTGTTRIRIRGGSDSAYTAAGACASVQYGETEDYILNIIAAEPCAGNPVVGIITSSTSSICNSGTATLTATGYATGFTGLTFQWFDNNGLIAGATQASYTTPVITATNSYYVRMTCSAGGFTDSNVVTINYQNPTIVSTTPASRCGGGSITIGATGSVGTTLKWYASPTGGSALFTGDNYTISNLITTTTYYVEAGIGTCVSSVRTAVLATITSPPALTLSSSIASFCVGESTSLVTVTSGLSDYDIFTVFPTTGVSGNALAGYVFSPTASTNYTLSAANSFSGCNRTATVSIVVNPLPAALIVTPSGPAVCSNGAPVALATSGGNINNVTIMTENFDTSAPLWTIANGGSSSAPANWAYATTPYSDTAGSATFSNFSTTNGGKFAMANGDAAALFTTTTTVLTSPVFSTVGYSSATLTFEHAYRSATLDGTIKLQVSTNGGTSWSDLVNYIGTSVGTTSNNAQTTSNATVSLNGFLNQPNLRIRYNYVSTFGYYWIIDNIRISGTDLGKVTWSPVDGLFANASGTIPYTGQPAATVYAKPTAETTYTATSASLTLCSVAQQVTIGVLTAENWFADTDGDGFGNSASTYFGCAQTGYVTNSTDCDDTNPATYRSGTFYVDADGDGYNNGTTQTICYGASVPFGYAINDIGLDCNDFIGAANPGHAEVLYNGVDDNCDGNLDEGFQYTTQLHAQQCGTTLSTINSFVVAYSIAAVTYHRFEITDIETGEIQLLERYQNYFSPTMLPSYNYARTYSVRVEIQRNGVWLGYYGPACLISTPAVLVQGGAATISPSQCGNTIATISTLIATTSLPNVTGYRFRITNATDPTAPNQVQIIDRGHFHWFSLTMLPTFAYGTAYLVEVSIKTNGAYSAYGSPCAVSSPPVPMLNGCGAVISTKGMLISTASLDRVTSYRFEVVNFLTGQVTTIDRSQNWFTFNNVPNFTPGAEYGVRVAVMTTGVYSSFGEGCVIIAPASARMIEKPFDVAAYPNPFSDYFMFDVDTANEENILLNVYDMAGRLIDSREADLLEIQTLQLGDLYPSGVYTVILSQGENIETLRIIKR